MRSPRARVPQLARAAGEAALHVADQCMLSCVWGDSRLSAAAGEAQGRIIVLKTGFKNKRSPKPTEGAKRLRGGGEPAAK